MKLNSQQFHQATFPGMEHLVSSTPAQESPPLEIERHSDRPVGMRGSIPERTSLPARRQRQRQNESRFESYQMRREDSDTDQGYGEEGPHEAETHPRTGLPQWGELDTHEHLGMGSSVVKGHFPSSVTYGNSAPSARRLAGTKKLVPLYDKDEEAHIATPQDKVSSQRVHQLLDDPNTGASPRFHGPGMEELPHVFHDRRSDSYHVLDGNHRVSSEILRGALFTPARVLTDDDVPEVKARTKKIADRTVRAKYNDNRNPTATDDLMDRLYGQ